MIFLLSFYDQFFPNLFDLQLPHPQHKKFLYNELNTLCIFDTRPYTNFHTLWMLFLNLFKIIFYIFILRIDL